MNPPELPAAVANINFEIAHRVVPRRPLHRDWPVCRHCQIHPETTEHVILYCPKVAGTLWPLLIPTLTKLNLNPQASDDGTLILSLGLGQSEGPATFLCFVRFHILSYHLRDNPVPAHLWPSLPLSDIEASFKSHIKRLFFRAGRRSSLRADMRLRSSFDSVWSRTASQDGLLTTDWDTNIITWHWGIT
jgi:hypothetical protein